jgi:nicotinamidase/pyrazinamidase
MKKILLRTLLALGGFILIVVVNLVIFNLTASRITEGTPITKTGLGHTVLLVIDIQEGTTGTVSALQGLKAQSDVLIGNVNQIIEKAVEKKWSVIYIKTEVANPLINLINNTMARGSEGAKLDKRLALSSDLIVTKRKNDSFHKTNLDQILQENFTEKLVMVGLDAEHCVYSAIQAALNRGYEVAVIRDGIIAGEEKVKIRMLREYRKLGVEIL